MICLTAKPEVIISRWTSWAGGRRQVAREDILQAQRIQEDVASNYALTSGVPLYFVNSDVQLDELAALVGSLLDRLGGG